MAEGRSNAAIAGRLFITEKAVGKHAGNIFSRLGLRTSDDDNVRVLASWPTCRADRGACDPCAAHRAWRRTRENNRLVGCSTRMVAL